MTYKLKIEMLDVENIYPKGLYFIVLLPSNISFLQLHKIIMECTNYQDYHLWNFIFENDFEVKAINEFDIEMRENPYNPNYKFPELLEASNIKLKQLFSKYNKAKYTYDFGDDNEFVITLLESLDGDLVPGVLEFEGRFPPEDIGGVPGHEEFIEAIKAGRKANEEQIDFRNYYKQLGYKKFSIPRSNFKIAKIVYKNYNKAN